MKNIYLIAGGVVAVLVWRRGAAKEAAKNQITEAPITDGTNWQGTMWDRLDSLDLTLRNAPNLNGSVSADPGRIGQAAIGLQPSWNGGL
jgi:hypothetical protein